MHERAIFNNPSKNAKHFVADRRKRHVGPHDDDGLQRLISTGNNEN